MANSLDKAVILQTVLDEQMIQGSLTGAMEANSTMVKYTGGDTIQIADIVTEGLTDYNRSTGFGSAAAVTLSFKTHTFDKDRGQTFSLDSMDVDETNFLATATSVMTTFQRTQVVPEVDAYRFSKIYALANAASKVASYTPAVGTIFDQLAADLAIVQDVIGDSEELIVYMSTPTATLLDRADKIEKKLDVINFTQGNISTKIRGIDGIPIIRVPSARLKTLYTFRTSTPFGFVANAGALSMNWVITAKRSVIAVTKTDKPRIFNPDVNQAADAYKIDYRKFHTLMIPSNKMEGIYVSYTPANDVVAAAMTLLTGNNTVTVTLTGGTYKTGVAITDFSFAGTDAAAIAAGTLVRTSDTVVTITIATGNTGTDNVITVEGSAQELQATSAAAVGSTV